MLTLAENFQHRVWRFIGWLNYHYLDHNRADTIRNGLIFLCMVLTVVSALLMKRSPIFGFVAVGGVAGLLGLLYIYRHMETSLLLLLPVTTVLNFGVGTGTGTAIMLSFVLLVAIWAAWMLRLLVIERSFKSVREAAPNWPTILFGITVIIAMYWGNYYVEGPVRPLMHEKPLPRMMTAIIFILSPVTTLMFGNFIRSMRSMKFIVWWFVIYGGIIAIFWIMGTAWPIFINTKGQLGVWTAMLALGQAFYNTRLRLWQRALVFAVPGMWFYIQFTLGISWLSGWIPIVLGFAGMAFLYSRKLFAVFVIIGIVFALNNLDYFSAIIEEENAVSGQTRVTAWDQTIRVVRDHFLFGTGPAGYYFYLTAYVGGLFQLSHNNYVDVVAQTGVVGTIFYVALWAGIGWMVLKAWLIAPRTGFLRGLADSLAVIFCLTLVVMMLGDWVIPFPYTQSLAGISYTIWAWMFAGVAIALYHYLNDLRLEQPE
jgi:O-antigen ligase